MNVYQIGAKIKPALGTTAVFERAQARASPEATHTSTRAFYDAGNLVKQSDLSVFLWDFVVTNEIY